MIRAAHVVVSSITFGFFCSLAQFIIVVPSALADDLPTFVAAPLRSSRVMERAPDSAEQCELELRVIEGRSRASKFSEADLEAGPLLTDLREQLQPLPFKSFRVLDIVKKSAPIKEESVFAVSGVQDQPYRLSVIPQRTDANRLLMTVHWTGPGGETLVETSLHAPMGKNVVLGTDSPRDASTILCLQAHCR